MHGLVRGFGDVVVTPHHHSTQAAMDVLAIGGNAVDAAIAANAVQGVVAPETCGIGGDLFALVHRPGASAPTALNASGAAGSNADPDAIDAAEMPLFGRHAVTVPGCVAGWSALSVRYGRLPLDRVLEPAIRLATDGVVATEELVAALDSRGPEFADQPIAAELTPAGRPPGLGDRLRRPALAGTLRRVADEGPTAFYGGPVAAAISEAVDGLITPADLAGYRPEWVDPLGLDVAGMRGWTIPPNSQGYLTLATLGILERLGDVDDPVVRTHREIEAYRAVAWERDHLVADPAHAPLTPEALVAEERLAERAGAIDDGRVAEWPAERPPPGGTAYLCVLDRDGLGISLMQSNFHGLGTTIGAGDAGFLLHNRGGGFTLEAGHPNRLGPGKRPLHTLSPTIWTDGDRLAAILGTRGGHQQPQLVAQVARRLWADGLAPDLAQDAPRWTTDAIGPGLPSRVLLESTAGPAVARGLASLGHDVTTVDRRGGWGPVSVITVDDAGLRSAAPDPRVVVSAAAVRG